MFLLKGPVKIPLRAGSGPGAANWIALFYTMSVEEEAWQTRRSGCWPNWSRRLVQCSGHNASHPLHHILPERRSSRSTRLSLLRCRTERYRTPFVPTAMILYNTSGEGRGLSWLFPSRSPPNHPKHTLESGYLLHGWVHLEVACDRSVS